MCKESVLVTGASGFIASALMRYLENNGFTTAGTSRSENTKGTQKHIHPNAITLEMLAQYNVIVHTAALNNHAETGGASCWEQYWKANVHHTLTLAMQAASAGVSKFIFLSSIKVNGESTAPGQFFTPDDAVSPRGEYAVSKWEAEKGLMRIARETEMSVVILRPPLVYGPGVKGNFLSLIRLIDKGLPLPIASIRNKRSWISLDNLLDLIVTCIQKPQANNQIFLASDGSDITIICLFKELAKRSGNKLRIFPCPVILLKVIARLLGREKQVKGLTGSLQIDITKNKDLLRWEPPHSMLQELNKCFVEKKNLC